MLSCSSSHAALCAVFMCKISFSAYGNKEEFEAFVKFEFQISKGAFARYLTLLSFVLLYLFIRKITSIFLDTYSLNIGVLPVFGLGLFQILFQMHSYF